MRLCTASEWGASCEGPCDVYRADGCWKIVMGPAAGGQALGPIASGSPFFLFNGAGFTQAHVGGLLSYGGSYYPITRYLSPTQIEAENQPTAPAAASGLTYSILLQWAYPYGTTYQASYCDGNDYPPANPTLDAPVATGSLAQCVNPAGVNDMSGNLQEWTEDYRTTVNGHKIYTLRGGGYADAPNGLACNWLDEVASDQFLFPTAGFRCCLPNQCNPATGQAVCPASAPKSCTADTDCTGGGLCRSLTYDAVSKHCVSSCTATSCQLGCAADGACAAGSFCGEPLSGQAVCSTSCTVDANCAALGGFCDLPADSAARRTCAACVDFASSSRNCGGCGVACLAPATCQNGRCQ
jgi:hypothetical protein